MALISLDVFDTAIFREVYKPTDIFRVVEDEVGRNFYNLRISAQSKACRVNIHYNIFDIYKYIPQFSIKNEIKAEYANCTANPYILDMYKNSGNEFIFISDMYLPKQVIAGMLERCGYHNPKVFVSCDYKALKGDGKLFSKVEQAIGRKIDKHIGDNYIADILGAKKAGIPESEFIGPPIYNRSVITPELSNVRLRKLLINKELSNSPIAEKVGYQFAPLALAFTQWILNEAGNKQTIFFNARDSYIFYIIARWILKTDKEIKYTRFSRKSCVLADILPNYAIKHPNNLKAFRFLTLQRVRTLRDFFKNLGIRDEIKVPKTLKEYNITLDSIIELNPKKKKILERAVEEAQSILYKEVRESRNNFLQYIKNLKMKNGDIFVDIGHGGTMQGIIKRVSKVDLRGRYVNTFSGGLGNYMGTYFEKIPFLPVNFVGAHTGVIEAIYSEPIGTSIGYTKDGVPILSKDIKYRKDITRAILKGIFKGAQDIFNKNIKVEVSDCTLLFRRFVLKPTLEEALFGNEIIFENGSLGNESIVWFNKDWIKKGKLKECYDRSYWKEAFKLLLSNDEQYKSLIREIR